MAKKTDIMQQNNSEGALFLDVCGIIDNARRRVAVYVNSEICLTKWYVGKRIKEDILYNQRAEYGKRIVKNLAAKLTEKYGSGWSDRSLLHCIRAAYTFTEEEIIYAVRRQFSWTHIRSLMFVEDSLARKFYMEMCRIEHWDTRTLDAKIDSQLYERTAISRRPEELITQELSKLKEDDILQPDLRRLVAIDLKLGKFKPEHEGQMMLYLRYLNQNERKVGEESPIGLILCSEGNTEHIEYLMLDETSPVKVAQYYTQLPDKKLLADKLQRAIAIAKNNITEQKMNKKEI